MVTLREFICFNQKEIIKYEYTISELHRNFKDLYRLKNHNKQDVDDAYDKLVIEGYVLMQSIFEKNLEYIRNAFGKKNNSLRFTVKMVEDEYVTDIFRSHDIAIAINETSYKENSAFNDIMNNDAEFYLNNDIELSFENNEYLNPRLVKGKPWNKAWNDYTNNVESSEYYNSTLVIPMSIMSTDTDKDSLFYNKYFRQQTNNKLNSKFRAIWGFVCLDSKEKNFFDATEDVELGFIVTDILSLYLIFYYNYAISSQTVLEYEERYYSKYS